MPADNSSSPEEHWDMTLEGRIALGVAENYLGGGAIIPFPGDWDVGSVSSSFAPGAGWLWKKLRDEGYEQTALYLYRDREGRVIYATARLDHPEKKKQVIPLRSKRKIGCNPWLEVKALEPPRPLYGLDLLAAAPDLPVLVVEGEKAADAGRLLFKSHVVVTWPGGAQGIAKVDLRPLAGRAITIWPDHDADGRGAARKLGARLEAEGAASVRIVQVPAAFPKKWDVADPVPELVNG